MPSQIFPRGPRVEIAGVLVPLLINPNELDAAVRRYAPAPHGMRGRRSVLVSVAIDAAGVVVSARAAAAAAAQVPLAGAPPLPGLARHDVSFGEPEGAAAPQLAAAAERAAQVARFLPAERAGAAVPFPDFRLTIVFDFSAPERSGLARPRV